MVTVEVKLFRFIGVWGRGGAAPRARVGKGWAFNNVGVGYRDAAV